MKEDEMCTTPNNPALKYQNILLNKIHQYEMMSILGQTFKLYFPVSCPPPSDLLKIQGALGSP